jgi:hypothetical protein
MARGAAERHAQQPDGAAVGAVFVGVAPLPQLGHRLACGGVTVDALELDDDPKRRGRERKSYLPVVASRCANAVLSTQ